MTKRKFTYEQSQAIEKANQARRANERSRRAVAADQPTKTDEQKAAWEAELKEAQRRYAEKKARTGKGWGG